MSNVLCTAVGVGAPVTSIAAAYPVGTVAGDVLIAAVAATVPAVTSDPIIQTGSDPWVQLAQTPTGTHITQFAVFSLVVPVGSPLIATFSTVQAAIYAVNMAGYTNVNPTTPINAQNPGINISFGAPFVVMTAPSILTTIQNTVLVYCASADAHGGQFVDLQTPPTGMTLEQSGESTFGASLSENSEVAIHDELFAPIGLTGPRTQIINRIVGPFAITCFNFMCALTPICLS